jgi:hypothetical protein
MPLGANKIQIRLENTDDYLSNYNTTRIVNLNQIADAFWMVANDQSTSYKVEITEKSLTGNMDLSEMLDRKI